MRSWFSIRRQVQVGLRLHKKDSCCCKLGMRQCQLIYRRGTVRLLIVLRVVRLVAVTTIQCAAFVGGRIIAFELSYVWGQHENIIFVFVTGAAPSSQRVNCRLIYYREKTLQFMRSTFRNIRCGGYGGSDLLASPSPVFVPDINDFCTRSLSTSDLQKNHLHGLY